MRAFVLQRAARPLRTSAACALLGTRSHSKSTARSKQYTATLQRGGVERGGGGVRDTPPKIESLGGVINGLWL
jgi:hypothetical protein